MKQLVLCTTVLFLLLALVGCTKEDLKINADEITKDTFIAKSDGELQVATVEDFDKEYYNLNELNGFIADEVSAYNELTGDKEIVVDDVLEREDKAIMILTYSGMKAYSDFNEVTAAYFLGGTENVSLDLPTTLINIKNDTLASTEEVIMNEKYKILVLTEPYEIVVDGDIKYYSENATLVDENSIQSAEEGMTVVVFR